MAISAMNLLSGIGAAAAGLAGEKVSKSGEIPGLDLAAIVQALLGNKAGGAAGIVGNLASTALKSGLVKNSSLAGLASSLFSSGKTTTAAKETASGGIAELAAAIAGSSGKGADLGSIAAMASSLAKNAKDNKGLTNIASDLGKTLNSSFGVNFNGGATALKSLDKVIGGGDIKGELFKAVLKGLV